MPLRPRKKRLNLAEVKQIEQQHKRKQELQVTTGVTAGQAVNIINAEGKALSYEVGEKIGRDLGNDKQEQVVALGNLDTEKGIIIADPITKLPTNIIGKDNFVYDVYGKPTPRTQHHINKTS